MIVYGLKNCDTTQKSLKLLAKNKIAYTLHDYKERGITKEKLKSWSQQAGLEKLFNKKSSTWRSLSAKEQAKAATTNGAMAVMLANTSIIKRPIIEVDDKIIAVGFDEQVLNRL